MPIKSFFDFLVLIVVYFFVFFRRWRARGRDVLIANTLMYIYLSFVLYFTLMPILTSLPFVFDHHYVPMNLEPFIDLTLSRGDALRQIILNIIMTIPFGFLLPLTNHRNTTFPKVILLTLLLSFTIELLQPLISSLRSSDITDVITNLLGGIIGYLFYLVFRPLTDKILNYLKTSDFKSSNQKSTAPTNNQTDH